VLAERFPEIGHLEVRLEDADGQDTGRVIPVIHDEDRSVENDATPVLVG
jgi:hypothetical protein